MVRSLYALALLAATAAAACVPSEPTRALTLLTAGDVLSLDPNRHVEAFTDGVLSNVYEPLVGFDADLRIQPLLAESWEHPQPERWRFRLRPGVRLHDGRWLTAALARDALLALRDDPEREASQFLTAVTQIEVVNDHVLDLVTQEPRALLASLPFVYVAPPAQDGGPAPFTGSGPYVIAARRKGRDVTLRRFDDYWGVPPAYAEATFLAVESDTERMQLFADGEGDVVHFVPPQHARDTEDRRFLRRESLTVYYLGLDVRPGEGNPLADVRVRRALHLALDRRQLVADVAAGAGTVATQPVAPRVFGYDPSMPPPEPDPEAARELLREAGLAEGFDLTIDVPRSRLGLGEHLREDFARIGVRVEVRASDTEELLGRGEAGRSRAWFLGWDCSSGEAGEFYAFCLRSVEPGRGSGNWGGYSNPRLDEIVDGNALVLDQIERQHLLQEAARIAMADLPVLPLFVPENIFGARRGVEIVPRPDGSIRLLDTHPTE